MAKQRLDVAVFERGLAPSREKAQAVSYTHLTLPTIRLV